MLGLLYRLIVGRFHLHKWETKNRVNVWASDKAGRPLYARVELCCKTCGDWKIKDLY